MIKCIHCGEQVYSECVRPACINYAMRPNVNKRLEEAMAEAKRISSKCDYGKAASRKYHFPNQK